MTKLTTARDVSEVAEEPKVSLLKYMLIIGVIVILHPNRFVYYQLEGVDIKGVTGKFPFLPVRRRVPTHRGSVVGIRAYACCSSPMHWRCKKLLLK